MQKNLIYLSKDEYKDFLISFDKLKKQRRIIQSIKDKKINSSDVDNCDISEFEEIDKLERLISAQIEKKCEELPRIRFKSETNSDEEKINNIGNTYDEDKTIEEDYSNNLFFEFEDNTEDVLNNSLDNFDYENKFVGKALFIFNGISSYFNNKNKNNKSRKVRVR